MCAGSGRGFPTGEGKGKKKNGEEKVLGQTAEPRAFFCLFAQTVDQLSICELFTLKRLVSGLDWPGRGFKSIRNILFCYLGPFSWESCPAPSMPRDTQALPHSRPARNFPKGSGNLPEQLLAYEHPTSSGPLPNHATQENHQINLVVQPPQGRQMSSSGLSYADRAFCSRTQ